MEAKAIVRALVATGGLACACCARADNLPFDYLPRPAGTSILGLRYAYGQGGDLYARGEKIDGDFYYQDQQAQLAWNYYGGEKLRWAVVAALPFGRTEAQSDRLHLDSVDTGLGDAQIVAAVWPLVRPDYSLGFSGWVFLPTGSYEPDRLVNQGLNVWSAKLEGNFTWRPAANWSLELASAVRFFDDNDDFGATHATLERDPRYTVETHVVRTLRKNLFASVDYFYHWGSETTVNGSQRDDGWDDHAAQLSMVWRLSQNHVLTLWYRNDFKVRSGPEYQTLGIRFMQWL
jgi:hypothetical protein